MTLDDTPCCATNFTTFPFVRIVRSLLRYS